MGKTAIIAGASGLIGSNLLQILLAEDGYDHVLAISRKKLPLENKKLKQLVIDLDKLDEHAAEIKGEVIFSCLGTTKAQTPDKALYRKIDHDYPLKLAQIGLKNGVSQFHLVSAVGANANSSTFYLRLKGETEQDLVKVGISSVYIYQPSMLKGRKDNARMGEGFFNGLMTVIDPLLFGSLTNFHSVQATDVARAMYNQSIDNEAGTFIYRYNDIIAKVPIILEITDTNFVNTKDWLFKLKDSFGEVVYVMDSPFYKQNGLKDPITKQHLDVYDIGMKLSASIGYISDKRVVKKISEFIIRDSNKN